MTPARARLSPWTTAGIDLLREGPRPKREVLATAASLVPPGHAIRTHNRTRNNPRKLSTAHVISVGSFWVVRKNFDSMVRRGSIIEIVHDGEVYWALSEKAHRTLTH